MIATIFRGTLAALLASLCVLVGYQVVARYVAFIPPFLWTEEMARTVFMWMVMIGAGAGFAEGTHFAFNFLRGALPAGPRRVAAVVVAALSLALMAFFVWSAWDLFLRGFDRRSLVTGLPNATSYGALLVGGVIAVAAILRDLWRALRGHPAKPHDADAI